jgi:hypothetical protein
MTNIPNYFIAGTVEITVQSNTELDYSQIGRQMTSVFGNRTDYLSAQIPS